MYGVVWDLAGSRIHKAVFPVFLQQSSVFQVVCIVLFDDLMYYWAHRLSHTTNFMWTFHQVHHQPERLNLTSSLRNSLAVRFSTILYYVPMALLFDPPVFVIFRQFNLAYQWWIHNDLVGKLGWLEYILNTPSQHRVHHGRNAYCIDKNYGGLFSIFDHLFGTYQEEIDEVPPVYGLTHSLNTLNPWMLNILPLKNIICATLSVEGWKAKWGVLWNGPGRIPGSNPPREYEIPPITNSTFQIQEPLFSRGLKTLLIVQTFGVLVILLNVNRRLPLEPDNFWYLTIAIGWCAWSVYAVSTGLNRNPGASVVQLVTTILGVAFFCLGSILRHHNGKLYYKESEFAFSLSLEILFSTLQQLTTYLALGTLMVLAILRYRTEMDTPLGPHEVARDLPCGKEAEDAQWAHFRAQRKIKAE